MTASVISDIACHLGEGPTYDPATGALYWFDILGRKLLEKRVPDGETVVHDLPFMASALAVISDEKQLIVAENGLYVRDVPSGRLTLHIAVEADNALTRSNDARVHPSGALWFGTMGKGGGDPALGAIYWYFQGALQKLYAPVGIPNSICFSPDGAAAYYVDTANNKVMRVVCDPANGLPGGEPKLFLDGSSRAGGVDGSVCDAEGILWNARWGSACVEAWLPDGTLWKSIPVPAKQASCPVFLGRHARHLGCTSAWEGMDEAERAADPQAGQTFLLDIEVKGRFEPRVAL